jgi:GTPase SAR1 family protein
MVGDSGVGKTSVLRAIPRRAEPVLKSQTRRTSMRTSKAFVLGTIIGQPSYGCGAGRWRST